MNTQRTQGADAAMKTRHSTFAIFSVIIVAIFVAIIAAPIYFGTGGFGPINTHVVTVKNKHVDYRRTGDSSSSHYMVHTDNGTFEVNNGFLLGVWNADEIYGSMETGQRYTITTKGNRVVGILMQEYPYIIKAVRHN
jgi:hypothetical protein